MTLSVITPVLNEETFLPLFLESVSSFADEVIIVDGGSTDRSVDWIKKYQKKCNIRLFVRKQSGSPYSTDWNESEVRNFMLEQASGDWIANLDVDEIFDDRFAGRLPALMRNKEEHVYQFPFVNFWGSPSKIRVNAPGDERWSNDIIRMWRGGIGIRYKDQKHHCTLETKGGGSIWKLPRKRVDIPLFHYHYAIGRRIKYNDNRRGDVNMWMNQGTPDWSYQHAEYEIRTTAFTGNHPRVIGNYLRRMGERSHGRTEH